jgi:hypothetical protein
VPTSLQQTPITFSRHPDGHPREWLAASGTDPGLSFESTSPENHPKSSQSVVKDVIVLIGSFSDQVIN